MDDQHSTAGTPSEGEAEATRAAGSICIGARAEAVFDFLADGTRAPYWLSAVTTSRLGKYEGGVGATYRLRLRDGGMGESYICYQVIHHRRPVMLGIEAVSLALLPVAIFRLTPVGRVTTELSLTVAVPATADTGSSDAALARRWTALLVASLPQLKTCLEALAPDN